MADYNPPTESLPIFVKSVFNNNNNIFITQAQADERYLRYPNAQGTQNFGDINVAGVGTFLDDVTISGTLTAGTLIFNTLTVNNLTVNNTINTSNITSSTNLNLNSSTGVRVNNTIILNSSTFTNRQVTSSYYNISDGQSTQTSSIQVARIFSLGSSIFFEATIVDNTIISFLTRRLGINYNPLILTDVSTFKTNVVMDISGSSILQNALSADTVVNTFKASQVITNYGGPSVLTALDIYDSGGGRGIRIVPFATNGAYTPLTNVNDSVIISRFRPSGGNIGLTIGLVDSAGTGIRLSSQTSSTGRIQIRAGSTNLIDVLDSSDATNPNTTTFNQRIRLTGTTQDAKSLLGISRISYSSPDDLVRGDVVASTSSLELQYKTLSTDHNHSFYTFNGTNFFRRLMITPTTIIQNVPTDTTIVTTFTDSQNGFTNLKTVTIALPSQTSITNKTTFILEQRGTYIITLTVRYINTNITTDTFLDCYWGISENGTTLPIAGLLSASIIQQQQLFIAKNNTAITTTSTCIYRASSGPLTLYINGYGTLTGTTQGDARFNISWCKIA